MLHNQKFSCQVGRFGPKITKKKKNQLSSDQPTCCIFYESLLAGFTRGLHSFFFLKLEKKRDTCLIDRSSVILW